MSSMLLFGTKDNESDLGHSYCWSSTPSYCGSRKLLFQFPEIREGVRRALLHRFPYSVYFKVSEEVIEVVGILHQYRNPTVWEQRIMK